jgi:hypothetical protein
MTLPRPRKVFKVLEQARALQQQLEQAYVVLRGLRACLEKLSAIKLEVPVEVELAIKKKSNEFGEYEYPVLRLCPQNVGWFGECDEVYVTRFKGFAEAFVEAVNAARSIEVLASDAKQVLKILEGFEVLLQRLSEEMRKVEGYKRVEVAANG